MGDGHRLCSGFFDVFYKPLNSLNLNRSDTVKFGSFDDDTHLSRLEQVEDSTGFETRELQRSNHEWTTAVPTMRPVLLPGR